MRRFPGAILSSSALAVALALTGCGIGPRELHRVPVQAVVEAAAATN